MLGEITIRYIPFAIDFCDVESKKAIQTARFWRRRKRGQQHWWYPSKAVTWKALKAKLWRTHICNTRLAKPRKTAHFLLVVWCWWWVHDQNPGTDVWIPAFASCECRIKTPHPIYTIWPISKGNVHTYTYTHKQDTEWSRKENKFPKSGVCPHEIGLFVNLIPTIDLNNPCNNFSKLYIFPPNLRQGSGWATQWDDSQIQPRIGAKDMIYSEYILNT